MHGRLCDDGGVIDVLERPYATQPLSCTCTHIYYFQHLLASFAIEAPQPHGGA